MGSRNKQIQGEVNPILTSFAIGYKNTELIGRKVAPVIQSVTESGTIYSFGKGGFKIFNSERALHNKIAQKIPDDLAKTTYRCDEHSLKEYIDDDELKAAEAYGAAQVLKLEQRTINGLQQNLELEMEKAIADIIFSTTYYDSGNRVALSGNTCWSDESNSTPISDISTGVSAARADMGIEPNAIVLGYDSWLQLKKHPDIIDKIKYSMKAVITEELVAEILGLKQVIVGKGVYATDTGVFTDIWTDNAALIYLPDNMEMAEGTTPHTVLIEKVGFPQVMQFDPEELLHPYAVRRKYDVKNVDTGFGYLITNTKA